jgi:hypothetical protein
MCRISRHTQILFEGLRQVARAAIAEQLGAIFDRHLPHTRAGRSLEHFDLACGLPAIVTADDSGLDLIRGQVLMFATAG